MPRRLDARRPGFAAAFDRLADEAREAAPDLETRVRAILADVKARGDAALLEWTATLDRLELTAGRLRVAEAEIDAATAAVPPGTMAALELAAERIALYHRRQVPEDGRFTDAAGATLGHRWTAIGAVGLYVPGGLAAYPSSVLMNAIPAKVAGVPRLAMTVPMPQGRSNPLVLAAARLAGVDEVYRLGGAQAVGALAFGTASVARVAKIVGPGNAWVAEAKRQVFGVVGIDTVAGPSEILVVADRDNDPAWLAADLLSQAEHDATAQAILITDDAGLADAVEAEVARQLGRLPADSMAHASWERFGAIVVLGSLAEAPPLVDRLAPEHLELCVAEPEPLAARVRDAGAIFLGRHTPEVIGDYVAGTNHVLPTARAARFASGLGVLDFMKRTSLVSLDAAALAALGPAAVALAEAEGLPAHARSVAIRLDA